MHVCLNLKFLWELRNSRINVYQLGAQKTTVWGCFYLEEYTHEHKFLVEKNKRLKYKLLCKILLIWITYTFANKHYTRVLQISIVSVSINQMLLRIMWFPPRKTPRPETLVMSHDKLNWNSWIATARYSIKMHCFLAATL